MKYSKLFSKTSRNPPKEADSINHKLLAQAGFIHQEMAGVFTYLPLGLRVLNKISQIVREEMDKIGGVELEMPTMHPGENWKKTGRFDSFDVLFKLKSANDKDIVLGPTHEEIIYPLVKEWITSYKDLPLYPYQIQTKFRNELRAKAGLLRGREFVMKDLYSFHEDERDRDKYYEEVRIAYLEIFKRIGLPVVETTASGGTFSELSAEFQTITPSGEDTVYVCKKCGHAVNKDVHDKGKCTKCGGEFEEKKAIEVGNIFPLKEAYSKAFDLYYIDRDGKKKLVQAGCYGIGISRTMGAIVEVFNDEKGIIWPEAVAPFRVHLIGLDLENEQSSFSSKSKEIRARVEHIYKLLQAEGIEVLYDDRVGPSAGEKFADADLIGIPIRVVISKKTGEKLEVKRRDKKETEFLSFEELKEKHLHIRS